MIPPDLLIQVAPIHWIGGFSVYTFISGLLIALSFSILYPLTKKRFNIKKVQSERQSILETIPSLESRVFERESALMLRNAIHILYLPKQSQAHTRKDISIYVHDPHILRSLEKLEISEYKNIPLNDKDRREIRATLTELREKIKNPTK